MARSTTKYDEKCDLLTKQYRLEFSMEEADRILAALGPVSCDDSECVLAQLLAATAVPVTSFVVSGSVVVVGNTVNWIEQQGKCDESTTQKAFDTLVQNSRAFGGKVIKGSVELIDWLKEKIYKKDAV